MNFKKQNKSRFGKYMSILLLCLLYGGGLTANAEKKAWAKFDDSTMTLTFYYSDKDELESHEYSMNDPGNVPGWKTNHSSVISKVVFDASFADARPTSCFEWFYEAQEITTIEGIQYLNTSEVTDMSLMFKGCKGLTELDLSNFDTSKVTDMSNMFDYCTKLTELNLSSFNTSNVTDMSYMFNNCEALTKLNLSSFNTSNVTNMSDMFSYCKALTELDLSSFNTSNVTDMGDMFCSCEALTKLNLSSFDTSNVTSMNIMFGGSGLTELDLSSFDTSNVTSMFGMFGDCSGLTELDLSSFDTSKVEYMQFMFAYSNNLKSLFIGEKFKKAAECGNMFEGGMSTVIYSLPSNYNTSKSDFYGFTSITVKPYVPINAKSEYGTICMPMGSYLLEGSFTGFDKLYTVETADADKGIVTLAEAKTIEPGVAYIYHRALADDTKKSFITFVPNYLTATTPANDGKLLKGTFESTTAPTGSYVLQIDGMFHPVGSTTIPVGAYRAYLDLNTLGEGGAALSKALRMTFGGNTTGIDSIGDLEDEPKVYFDLSGRRVSHPQRGQVYILKGKKVKM